jgi:hypothetical protein
MRSAACSLLTVYWSQGSTLPRLAQWIGNSMGTFTIPTIPGGMMQVVEIPWADSAIPNPGNYSFVGIIGTTKDHAPSPLMINNWASYRSFIRNNNNVTLEHAQGSTSNVGSGAVATGGSIGVGNVNVGGNLSGNIVIGNNNQASGNSGKHTKKAVANR